MTDILIRNVPESDVRAIDDAASRAGLSRNQFLRRALHTLGSTGPSATLMDFAWLAEVAADIKSPDFNERAWS